MKKHYNIYSTFKCILIQEQNNECLNIIYIFLWIRKYTDKFYVSTYNTIKFIIHKERPTSEFDLMVLFISNSI